MHNQHVASESRFTEQDEDSHEDAPVGSRSKPPKETKKKKKKHNKKPKGTKDVAVDVDGNKEAQKSGDAEDATPTRPSRHSVEMSPLRTRYSLSREEDTPLEERRIHEAERAEKKKKKHKDAAAAAQSSDSEAPSTPRSEMMSPKLSDEPKEKLVDKTKHKGGNHEVEPEEGKKKKKHRKKKKTDPATESDDDTAAAAAASKATVSDAPKSKASDATTDAPEKRSESNTRLSPDAKKDPGRPVATIALSSCTSAQLLGLRLPDNNYVLTASVLICSRCRHAR
jgi:hypothetical protein